MSLRGKRKRQHRQRQLGERLKAQRRRLDQLEAALAVTVAKKKTIYLDTNHWVHMQSVLLGRARAKTEYGEVLAKLEKLVSGGVVCCPLSSSLFEELMKQSNENESTRRVTAQLMDRLSQRTCLQFIHRLAAREWRHNVWKIALKAEPTRRFPVWTSPGFWANQDHKLEDLAYWVERPEIQVEEWVDRIWAMGFEDVQALPDFFAIPDEMVMDWVQTTNDAQLRAEAMLDGFDEMRRKIKSDFLDGLKDVFFKEPLPNPRPLEIPTTIFSSFVDEHDPWIIPPLQIQASIYATVLRSNRVFRKNDVLDVAHAASAIPYCSAFLCDTAMKNLLTNKPLEFDKVYGTLILSKPDEILNHLEHIA